MTGRRNELDEARERAGLTLSDLWVRYFAAGGDHGAIELDAVIHGALLATREEHDLIAQVLNERFTQLGAGTPVPYLDSTDYLAATDVEAPRWPAPRVRRPSTPGRATGWVVDVLALDPDNEAPGAARRWARQLLHAHGYATLIHVTASGLTELVTNVCLHARTAMTVTMCLTEGTAVRFQVRDHSPALPVSRHTAVDATSGRGLQLVAACGQWGVEAHVDGKTVWFEPHLEELH